MTAFLGEDFDLDVYGLDELGRFTAVVLTLSDANVSYSSLFNCCCHCDNVVVAVVVIVSSSGYLYTLYIVCDRTHQI